MAGTILRLNGISKLYGGKKILSDIDLEILRSDILGIIGPNGSGKSTLIKIMLGLVHPSAGSVTHTLLKPAKIGAVLDEPGFFPGFTVNRNLAVFMSSSEPSNMDSITEVLGVKPWLHRPFRLCSTGIRKRCELAAALQREPGLLVLDEPTNGLDPTGIYEFRTIVRNVHASGCPVVITSHVLNELEKICTRFCFLRQGVIQKVGLKNDFLSRFKDLEEAYRFYNLEIK